MQIKRIVKDYFFSSLLFLIFFIVCLIIFFTNTTHVGILIGGSACFVISIIINIFCIAHFIVLRKVLKNVNSEKTTLLNIVKVKTIIYKEGRYGEEYIAYVKFLTEDKKVFYFVPSYKIDSLHFKNVKQIEAEISNDIILKIN